VFAQTSFLPPETADGTYVKATSNSYGYYEWRVFNDDCQNGWSGWLTAANGATDQRINVDLGAAVNVNYLYYENGHHNGTETSEGANHFTMWGSNSADSFADVNYADDTGWTQLSTNISQFIEHDNSAALDPHYVTAYNYASYRYYSIKVADDIAMHAGYINICHLDFEYEPLPTPSPSPTLTPTPFPTPEPFFNNEIATTTAQTTTGSSQVWWEQKYQCDAYFPVAYCMIYYDIHNDSAEWQINSVTIGGHTWTSVPFENPTHQYGSIPV
jgi:hypothetical protein